MIKYFSLFLSLFASLGCCAQVTTGTLAGTVKDAKGEVLEGATIVATYLPAKTVYSALSGADGQYIIAHVRVGGPYQIKVTFIGYNPLLINGITVTLGTIEKLDI